MGSNLSEGNEYHPFSKSKTANTAIVNSTNTTISTLFPEKAELERFLSRISLHSLTVTGFLEIASKILKHCTLTKSECFQLLRAPLPILAVLIKIFRATRFSSCETGNQQPLPTLPLQRLVTIPVAAMLSEHPPADAASLIVKQLDQLFLAFCPPKVFLALDAWIGDFSTADLSQLLQTIQKHYNGSVAILGPSTSELRKLLGVENSGQIQLEHARSLFQELQEASVFQLEGGGDLRLHCLATTFGLSSFVGQNISRTRLGGAPSSFQPLKNEQSIGSEKRSEKSPALGKAFVDELFHIREELLPSGKLKGWAPWSPVPLDRGIPAVEAPLGLELLRAIAVARLTLPEVEVIRAPLSLLGAKLAHLALQYGASDFGFAALDSDTAKQLGLVRYQEAELEFVSTGEFQLEGETQRQ